MSKFKMRTAISFRLDKSYIDSCLNDLNINVNTLFLSTLMIFISKHSTKQDISIISQIYDEGIESIDRFFVFNGELAEDKIICDFIKEVNAEVENKFNANVYDTKAIEEYMCDNADNELTASYIYIDNREADYVINEKVKDGMKVLFEIRREEEFYNISILFNKKYFDENTMNYLSKHYNNILKEVIESFNKKIEEINVISKKEESEIISDFNKTYCEYDKSKSIIQLFRESVDNYGDKKAIVFHDVAHTYLTVDKRTGSLGTVLHECGVKANDFVAVISERSFQLVEGIYGVLKSGGAYVPIDPHYPDERIKNILEECNPKAILVYAEDQNGELLLSRIKKIVEQIDNKGRILDLRDEELWSNSDNNYIAETKINDAAYCIFTSGSTGKPKGVVIENCNVVNYVNEDLRNVYGGAISNETNKILGVTAMTFDIFVTEIILSLIHGMELYLLGDDEEDNIDLVANIVNKNEVNVLQTTPSRIKLYLESSNNNEFLDKFKVILMGGESVPSSLCSKLSKYTDAALVNVYGPSEATVWATMRNITEFNSKNIIGKPMANVQIYILNKYGICGIGIPGELCIAGDGVARGYLNNNELTNEKFVDNPFGEGKLYHTGDLASWTADGTIEFIGRIDEQVKVRGFRIELEEIENVIRSIEDVKDAVVIARNDEYGDKSLYAYMISNHELNIANIRDIIKRELPDYMIPSYMTQIEKMPLSTNGKLDRKALPKITNIVSDNYEEPSNEVEEKICGMFEDILSIEEVGINDNFFYLGGHSLKAIRLINDIVDEFKVLFKYRDIFENNTPKSLAKLVELNTGKEIKHLPRVEERDYYQMSQAQKRMYYVQMIDSNATTYNLPQYFELKGNVDEAKLKNAFQELIDNNEILRTKFIIKDNDVVQVVAEDVVGDYEYIEKSNIKDNDIKSLIYPFNLEKPSQVRLKLIKDNERYLLFIDMHHIISDGMTQEIFIRNLFDIYIGKAVSSQDRYQYKDYSEWIINKDFSEQKEYWMNVFDDIPVLELPLDYKRPKVQDFKGNVLEFTISKDIKDKVLQLSEKKNVTEYMILLSAFMITVSKYSNQEDIVLGSVIEGRGHQDIQDMIGMFINTIALRAMPNKKKTFSEFLNEIKEICLSAYENQDYPFDSLVEDLEIEREVSRNPLFDVMFAFQGEERLELISSDISLFEKKIKEDTAKFDMTVEIFKNEDEYKIKYGYRTSLYKEESINEIGQRLISILNQAVSSPEENIANINGIDEKEERLILNEINDTSVPFNKNLTIPEMLDEQAKKYPDNLAVVYKEEKLTYSELLNKVDSLALVLREKGIKQDDLVAIISDKSLEMIQGVYGIMKSGGAYVPIDPMYPNERIKYMLSDCKPKVLLVYEEENKNKLEKRIKELIEELGLDVEVINMQDKSIWCRKIDEVVKTVNKSSDLAYCIYTSGTTGKPKGVLVEHRGIASMRDYLRDLYEVTSEDRVLQFANYIFDASVWEMTISLLNGATLYIVSSDVISDVDKFNSYVEESKITLTLLPPQYYLQTNINCLRVLTTGGSASTEAVIRKVNNRYRYINAYGPTENTVLATHWEYKGQDLNNIPIGRAINNSKIYIMNDMQLCGIGMPGELCITGDGLARGYLNMPKLTEERFIKNIFEDGRMYRTGDLARMLSDGTIEYMGRIDEQVKIRGFRIELGDIENAIRKIEDITDVVVVALEGASGDKELYAYYVSDKEISVSSIKQILELELPSYMIPTYMMQIESIPVNRSGKVDKRALPKIETKSSNKYIAPRTDIEKVVCAAMEQVLNVKNVGMNDGFFELGGDSIKAIRVVSKIREAGISCSVKDIMNGIKPVDIVKRIGKSEIATYEQGEVTGEVLSTPIVRWFLSQNITKVQHFNQSMVLKSSKFEIKALDKAFEFITNQHDILRAVYSDNKLFIKGIKDSKAYEIKKYTFNENDKDISEVIYREGTKIQESFDLENGPLVKGIIFTGAAEEYLLIVIHHFLVDGVSWRIIIEDLTNAYEEYLKSGHISKKAKTASFKMWAEALKEYEDSRVLAKEKGYWDNIDNIMQKNALQRSSNKDKKIKEVIFNLDERETEGVLYKCNSVYNTQINDLLLSALGMSIKEVFGYNQVVVGMEGHGREELHKSIDIDRTVGWFTSYYPIVLNVSEEEKDTIIETKEMFRNIPNNGLGYGVLRYGSKDITNVKKPSISFNYLGSFDEDKLDNTNIQYASYLGGKEVSDENRLSADIILDGVLKDHKIEFNIQYDNNKYSDDEIIRLGNEYKAAVDKIIKHCEANKDFTYKTATDYKLYGISNEEFKVINNVIGDDVEVIDMFKLTSMQKGLLFHQLNNVSGEYFVQSIYSCPRWVNKELVEKALYILAEKNEILKSMFVYESGITPVQVILKERRIECNLVNVSEGLDLDAIRERDVLRGFDLSKDSLLRVTLVNEKDGEYKIIFSMHHIIVDGWSVAILFNDFQRIMNEFNLDKSVEEVLEEVCVERNTFGDYTRIINSKNTEEGIEYWKELLEDYEGVSTIAPMEEKKTIDNKSSKEHLVVDNHIYERLIKVSRKNAYTLNNYVEAAIGLLLQNYNSVSDVVFGKVISGRNVEMDGIEDIPGIFINTIPVRVCSKENMNVSELVNSLKEQSINSTKYDYIGLSEIQNKAYGGNNLINILFAFENYYMGEENNTVKDKFIKEYEREQTNYDLTFVAYEEKELHLEIMYEEAKYSSEEIKTLLRRLEYILDQISTLDVKEISEVEITMKDEKEKINNIFNDTNREYRDNACISELIEYQAEHNSDKTALYYEGNTYTYKELNESANSLARELREKNIIPNDLIVIISDRGPKMIQGIYGIIKSGAAYVPIDPTYPLNRIKYMIEDCNPKVVLLYEDKNKSNNESNYSEIESMIKSMNIEIINLSEEDIWNKSKENLTIVNKPNDLAYAIYTSGTTGKPKGVLVEHQGVSSMASYLKDTYEITSGDRVLQFANYIFDASVWEMTISLYNGAALYLVTKDTIGDMDKFNEYVNKNNITITLLPPQYYIQTDLKTLRILTTGGSAANKNIVKKAMERCRYINAYGPTENTVLATHWECTGDLPNLIPIGKPIYNSKLHILNGLKECGIGIVGELCITGPGVARGYLNRDEITRDRFIKNPFGEGRMYRTGDLARWMPDGNIQYMGRIDEQIKIRGFRIELGDIENALRNIEHISDAASIVVTSESGDKEIWAYYVSTKEYKIQEIKNELVKELPDYMVPKRIMQLDSIPMTRSGKLDKKELPKIEIVSEFVYEEAQTIEEKVLSEVLSQILNVQEVGRNDNFFELGGDSITAIRVISKIRERGYQLAVSDVMKDKVVSIIATKMKTNKVQSIDQGAVSGKVETTPIMKWFLEQDIKNVDHFNMAFILNSKEFNKEILKAVLGEIVRHHDMLRAVYKDNQLYIRDVGEDNLYDFNEYVLDTNLSYDDKVNSIKEIGTNMHKGINLEEGPIVKCALVKSEDEDYFIFIVHHFAIDGISLRILAEDIKNGYLQYKDKGRITLPNKTTSFIDWSKALKEYSQSNKLKKEYKYWSKISNEIEDADENIRIESSRYEKEAFYINQEDTLALLNNFKKPYNTSINDLLLAALSIAYGNITGKDKVSVSLEGHGREVLHKEIPVDRTIGWFTINYPVIIKSFKNIQDTIINTKEALRSVPNNGIGYGVLRYYSDLELKNINTDVLFNYLGNLNEQKSEDEIKMTNLSSGEEWAENNNLNFGLVLNIIQEGNRFKAEVTYNSSIYNKEKIDQFKAEYIKGLVDITSYCISNSKNNICTASDYKLYDFLFKDFKYIERFFDTNNLAEKVRDIYRLTPLQQGMLFHQMNSVEGEYFIQSVYSYGSNIDSNLIKDALGILAEKHEVLKTVFIYENISEPLQAIVNGVTPEVIEVVVDDDEDFDSICEKIKEDDKRRGFILDKDSLLRVTLVNNKDRSSNYMIWGIHHIIVDGWSFSSLFSSFEEICNRLLSGESKEKILSEIAHTKTTSYGDYVRSVLDKDSDSAISYWDNLLEGYDNTAEIVPVREKKGSSGVVLETSRLIPNEFANKLENTCKKYGITMSTCIETSIGIILQNYNNISDVVFGKVVSGRDSEIKGIEEISGLFINTIPQRITSEPNTTLTELLHKVQEQSAESSKYDFIGLSEILKLVDAGKDLIKVIFAFENYYVSDKDEEKTIFNRETFREQTNYDITFSANRNESGLEIDIMYNSDLYDSDEIERILDHLELVLQNIEKEYSGKISELEIITDSERNQIINEFNNTFSNYPNDKTVSELLEEAVEESKDDVAIVYRDISITYGELNRKANKIAAKLRDIGITADDFVAIITEKSIEMIIGICGIIKAGAAYVPIDPAYPEERNRYILSDCNPKALVKTNGDIPFETGLEIVDIYDEDLENYDGENLEIIGNERSLAYSIYTSGTTGKPKGTLIEQRSIVRLVKNTNYVELNKDTIIMQTGSMAFDASTFEVWGILLNGGKLILADQEILMNPVELKSYLIENKVNTLFMTTALYNQMIQSDVTIFDGLKYFFIGGEKHSEKHVNALRNYRSDLRFFNIYGPTENTTFTTYYEIPQGFKRLPIGKPISNTQVYVLNGNKMCGIGMAGELCTAGDGVARGYLNRKDLTDEKFVDNPYGEGKMYRSGDLVRWLPSGDIEFIGRIDEQVKIRGFRIETLEIENALRDIEDIRNATVIVKTLEDGEKVLNAYFESDVEKELSLVKEKLSEVLPDYMVPSYLMQIDKIPVTRNGKVDKRALPEITVVRVNEYVEASNEIEDILCSVFAQILNVEKVGRNDSFFELGGDSIKAIRVVSRIREAGLRCNIKDILKFKTVDKIAANISKIDEENNYQGEVYGKVELTPIMNWFVKQDVAKPEHFNQSIMLKTNKFDMNIMHIVLEKLVEHHDMLRSVWNKDGMEIRRVSEGKSYDYFEYDLSNEPEEIVKDKIFNIATKIQSSIDLENGPLMKVILFKCIEEEHLCIIVHHLAIDGVSWRILIEDIQSGYKEYKEKNEINFASKTASFKDWALALKEYASSKKLEEEKEYWLNINEKLKDINEVANNSETKSYKSVSLVLDEENCDDLVHKCNNSYNTNINDLLLTALGRAWNEVTNKKSIAITLEGHGREEIHKPISIDRTVGWFTCCYPVIIETTQGVKENIIKTKEMIRSIPNNGIGYGVLKYFNKELLDQEEPNISFNYMGDFAEKADGEIVFSQYESGIECSDENMTNSSLIVSGVHEDKKIRFNFEYDEGIFDKKLIEEFAKSYIDSLKEIICHCTNKDTEVVKTASDYGLNDMDMDDFNDILGMINDSFDDE